MKRLFSLLALILMTSAFSFGQNKKGILTEHIKVSGVCNECKERIENAAYIHGVKRAEWDKDSKDLTVTFKADKVTLLQIEESIAKSGHDAGEVKATDSAYNKLPSCCAYKDGHDH